MSLHVVVLVVLHRAHDLLITQFRQLVTIAISLLQAVDEDTAGHVPVLHRRAPQGILHRGATALQIHPCVLQARKLLVVVLVLDEVVLVATEGTRVPVGDLLPAIVEGLGGRRQATEFGAVTRARQVFVHPAHCAGELVGAIGNAAMVALSRGNPARAAIAGFVACGSLAAVPAVHRLLCVGHHVHAAGLLGFGGSKGGLRVDRSKRSTGPRGWPRG